MSHYVVNFLTQKLNLGLGVNAYEFVSGLCSAFIGSGGPNSS